MSLSTSNINLSLPNKTKSINSIYSSSVSALALNRSYSRDLSTSGSRLALNRGNTRKDKQAAQQNAINYKLKKQLEGEESEREPETTGILKWKWSKREDTELYSIKFSQDRQYLAASGGNGTISVYSMATNSKELTLDPKMLTPLPCTAVAFRPFTSESINKNVIGATYADGTIRHWHATTGQLISTIQVDDVQLMHLSYNSNGSKFTTCASDNNIRVYDASTNKIIFHGKDREEQGSIGHTNRIFCSKFHPKDDRLIVSGGWDDCILIWDTRHRNPVRTIFGPRICGDALDFDDSGTKLLSGSYTRDNNIQIWSWQSGELLESLLWSNLPQAPSCMLYSAQFSRDKLHTSDGTVDGNRFILAGGKQYSLQVQEQ
jgi:WD40 repeat protein